MRKQKSGLGCLIILLLSGCGTYVPEIQEYPQDARAGQQLVQAIATNVTCEVQDAVYAIYKHRKHTFMDSWGVQTTLMLTIDEKNGASPSVDFTPPGPASALFNLSAGATVSADATRIDKLNSYQLVKDLRQTPCPPENRLGGPFLLQSDLKLQEWLFDVLELEDTKTANLAGIKSNGTNVLSHEVKFEVLSSGNVTPTLKLTRVSINPTGSLLSASRDRTHDLIITFGPVDEQITAKIINGRKTNVVVAAPSSQAAFQHLSSTIGASVSQGFASAVR